MVAQTQSPAKLYAHKVVVDSCIQTKAYTYLKVKERLKEKDSLQWMALPTFPAKIGDVYYYDGGLQMGEFQSRELNRTFKQILFLGTLGTTPEVSEKNVVPAPVYDTIPQSAPPREVHTVVVKEVLQTSGYSYLRVMEGEKEEWLAIVKIPAVVGQTYSYDDASSVTDFQSKELNRTFKEIYFLAKIRLVANPGEVLDKPAKKKPAEKITIAKLWKNKKSYSGKTVIISGKVTKFSENILGKNWIHIDDGTDYSGKADITATIDQVVKVGDNVTVEGTITTGKDFGSGYYFDVIMENAKVQIKH
ncbi:MAG TPA: hypothetical protein VII99_12455 [Bacteroidia bacterium]